MNDNVKRPLDVLRDGNLKSSIWENENDKGKYYSASLVRTYRDQNGRVAESNSYGANDLLKLAHLSEKTYDSMREHQTNAYAEQQRQKAEQSNQQQAQQQQQQQDRNQ